MAGADYREAHNAVRVVEHEAAPQLPIAARAIARAVPEFIPTHQGIAKRLTKTSVQYEHGIGGGHPSAQVLVKSPFWHFLEFGTRFNPPYRPIAKAVQSLHLRYVTR